jgi:DNA-binding IclR family transcriptional regulator
MSRPALAADRALQVIDLMVAHPTESFTLAEITRRTGINPASAHALTAVMLRSGYLQRHPTQKTYSLGPALVASGAAALDQLPAIRAAQAEIGLLSDELRLEVTLTAPTDEEIIVVGAAGDASEFGSVLQIGQRLPLSPPLGSVFLAWSTPDRVEQWVARARPPFSPNEIERQNRVFDAVRSWGYAIGLESPARRGLGDAVAHANGHSGSVVRSHGPGTVDDLLAALAKVPYQLSSLDERRTYDVSMIAAPVFDTNRRVCAAITVSGLAPAAEAADIVAVAERVRGAALVITKRARGRLPEAV